MYTETKALHAQKTIAMFVALVLLFLSTGFHLMGKTAHADNVEDISDTLSDSTPGASSNHTLQFTLPNGMATGQSITVTFPATFLNIASLAAEDVDLATSTDEVVQDGAAGTHAWGFASGATTVTLTSPSAYAIASSTTFTLEIGDNATSGATGDTFITNPTSTSTPYEINVATTWDSGDTQVAIVENVHVTANVNTLFTFTVQGTTTGATISGSPTTTLVDTTSTLIPFGTLQADVSEVLGQDLFVETNAINGFVVTVETTEPFDSGNGADIDTFTNGTDVTSPTTWSSPNGTIGFGENGWGHWGVTSDDDDFASGVQDRWMAASTTPRAIFQHNGVADGSASNIGYTNVGYQVEISSLQEAADDYDTYLIYIATPTF